MFHRHDDHLADDELLRALDQELSLRRHAAVGAHLARCAACRTRSTALERHARELTVEYARDPGPGAEGGEGARARLHWRLGEASAQWDRSWSARLASAIAPAPRWTWAGAGLIAAAVVMAAVLPWARVDRARPVALVEADALPVAALTPGVTSSSSAAELCQARPRDRERIPAAMRLEVLQAYGMERVPSDQYELDYLVTPELGGATAARNLWPQRYASRTWNAHVKDQLERLLPAMVCSGLIDLETAQRDIAVDWVAAYRTYFKTRDPLAAHAGRHDDDDAGARAAAEAPRVITVSFVSPRNATPW